MKIELSLDIKILKGTLINEDCNPRMVIPNIFTPNGDSVNELLLPREHKYIESGNVVIYNF